MISYSSAAGRLHLRRLLVCGLPLWAAPAVGGLVADEKPSNAFAYVEAAASVDSGSGIVHAGHRGSQEVQSPSKLPAAASSRGRKTNKGSFSFRKSTKVDHAVATSAGRTASAAVASGATAPQKARAEVEADDFLQINRLDKSESERLRIARAKQRDPAAAEPATTLAPAKKKGAGLGKKMVIGGMIAGGVVVLGLIICGISFAMKHANRVAAKNKEDMQKIDQTIAAEQEEMKQENEDSAQDYDTLALEPPKQAKDYGSDD
eukprot:g9978.t1